MVRLWDNIYLDIHLACLTKGGESYGVIEDGALAVKDGRIAWVGSASALPGAPSKLASSIERLNGAWVTPGLIDCHTHLVFAGERAGEFERRLNGASYEEIARAGDGIASTVRATRAASLDELTASANSRLRAMARLGVTTVEVKSGYGLSTDAEIRMLEAATAAGREVGVRVLRTFLGLHALPPEYAGDRAGYVRLVINEMLPAAHERGLVDAVDAFCEGIGFTVEEVSRVFEAARGLGLPVKLHAEQLSDLGGAGLAARFGALSADHLEYINDADIAALAQNDSVAVLLPGAFYYLKEKRTPPVDRFRAHGVRMALASDFNPGTSPLFEPGLVMNMGCTLFGMTPEESLSGMTVNAAAALGLSDEIGTLEVGKAADFVVWNVSQPAELSYWIGGAAPSQVFAAGREIARA